ncbi:MAG: KpsF/GutQ family sugar-phosphate isomerase [Legionellaceae bacterium]|nr:KpsF/GutQ family sugar-phosphate isomerase [Legionellaceae bacterium]
MNFCHAALAVIENEAYAINKLSERINQQYERACQLLMECKGRVVVTGMGKSGHIGKKIAATFASTGTPAFFMHPGEAAHGDLGMLTPEDCVLAISYSGNTNELLLLLPIIKRQRIPIIAMTGHLQSSLAQVSDAVLDISIEQEACPLGLAPTTSTTVTLVMGDALAVSLLQAKGFRMEDFALSHPSGNLGRRLLLRIDALWHDGDKLPVVPEECTIHQALIEVTEKKLGMTCVVNAQGKLSGVFTDGDIRRTLTKYEHLPSVRMQDVMSTQCKTVSAGLLASEALALMQQHKITSLVVVDPLEKPQAIIHIHDLLRAGVI